MSAVELREPVDPSIQESVLLRGDLRSLTPQQKLGYYKSVCESLGLNPLTQPFAYIVLNGKEMLYAKRDAAEQLRKIHSISIIITSREVIEGCYIVTAKAMMPSGRVDESTGAVAIDTLKGEARANALLKAETKAKRRVTLSICGLGLLDESEVDSIPGAKFGESSAKVTTEPITIGRPKDATGAVVTEGGSASSSESAIVAEGDSKASPTFSNADEPSTLEQQTKFAMAFRDALPEKFRPHADQLRKAALAEEGYLNDKGEGSSKAIKREEFGKVANRLIRAAKQMKEPFIANADDLPGNI